MSARLRDLFPNAAGSGAVWECAVTGVTPTLIRCPYGEYDDHVITAIRSMGMEPIQWDVETLCVLYK